MSKSSPVTGRKRSHSFPNSLPSRQTPNGLHSTDTSFEESSNSLNSLIEEIQRSKRLNKATLSRMLTQFESFDFNQEQQQEFKSLRDSFEDILTNASLHTPVTEKSSERTIVSDLDLSATASPVKLFYDSVENTKKSPEMMDEMVKREEEIQKLYEYLTFAKKAILTYQAQNTELKAENISIYQQLDALTPEDKKLSDKEKKDRDAYFATENDQIENLRNLLVKQEQQLSQDINRLELQLIETQSALAEKSLALEKALQENAALNLTHETDKESVKKEEEERYQELSQEKNDLEVRSKEEEKRRKELSDDLKDQKEVVKSLDQENKRLSDQLNSFKVLISTNKTIADENARLRYANASLTFQLLEQKSSVTALKSDQVRINAILDEEKVLFSEYEETIARLNDEVEASIEVEGKEIEDLQKVNEALALHSGNKEELKRLRDVLAEKDASLNQLRDEKSALTKDLQTAINEKNAAEAKQREEESELQKKVEELAIATRQRDELEEKIRLKNEASSSQDTEVREALKDNLASIDEMKGQILRLEAELLSLMTALKEANAAKEEAQESNVKLAEDLEVSQTQLVAYELEKNEFLEKLATLGKEETTLKQQLADLNTRNEELVAEKSGLLESLNNLQTTKATSDKAKRDAEEEKARLTQQLEDLNTRNQDLLAEKSSVLDNLESLQTTKATSDKAKRDAEAALLRIEEEKATLTQQLEDLNRQNEELLAEKAGLLGDLESLQTAKATSDEAKRVAEEEKEAALTKAASSEAESQLAKQEKDNAIAQRQEALRRIGDIETLLVAAQEAKNTLTATVDDFENRALTVQTDFAQALAKAQQQREKDALEISGLKAQLKEPLAPLDETVKAEEKERFAPDYKKAAQSLFGHLSEAEQTREIVFYREKRQKSYEGSAGNVKHTQIDLRRASDEAVIEEIIKDKERSLKKSTAKLVKKLIDKEPLTRADISVALAVGNNEEFQAWRDDNPKGNIGVSFFENLQTDSKEEAMLLKAMNNLSQTIASYAVLFGMDEVSPNKSPIKSDSVKLGVILKNQVSNHHCVDR